MGEPIDKGNKIAVQRALDAFCRARGSGFIDRQTAMIFLLEALEEDWTRVRAKSIAVNPNDVDALPNFPQLARAAARMFAQNVGNTPDAGMNIQIFRFHTAPPELQALSPHGGDEDWIAIVPTAWREKYHLAFLDPGFASEWFGCSGVSEHTHASYPNCLIFIGAHA
jgi:hypothetical protein